MLTNVELLALDRVIDDKDKSIRNSVMPGSYSVDFTVHVSGNMEVLEDYMKRPTVNVPWTEAYTLFREVAIQAVNEMIARVDKGEVITRHDLEVCLAAGFLSEAIMVETMKQAYDLHEGRCSGSIKERIPEIKERMEEVKKAIVQLDRFFPSSKTCSSCSWINEDLKLKDRKWKCRGCGILHDRDKNAAEMILKQGKNTGGTPGIKARGSGNKTSRSSLRPGSKREAHGFSEHSCERSRG